ncbi:MAG: hypothetical protein ACPGJV_00225 [Bacteriovoracaceae bacterium]
MRTTAILILVFSGFLAKNLFSEKASFLERFQDDPKAASWEPPHKTYKYGRDEQDFSKFKNQRQLPNINFKAGYKRNDDIANFVIEGEIIKNLTEMESYQLASGRVSERPWSDDYWALAKGGLGARYSDPEFTNHFEFKELYDYYKENPSPLLWDEKRIDMMSPSEKYDLLFSSQNFPLTEYSWKSGLQYYYKYGEVESWMGICHGWAIASYNLKRPKKAVTVKAFDGVTDIKFYPSDIKALASLLYANVRTPTLFIGGRCNSKEPKIDEENGRVIEDECYDNNPASFHMALVNEIGIRKRSFIMDATYDYEVWNQPVIEYSYQYFNPKTQEETDKLEIAEVAIDSFENDVYQNYRSEKAKYVVGVVADVIYALESTPSHRETDGEHNDNEANVRYYYDLELNANREIIGGEWYQMMHPDFLWTNVKNSKAESIADSYLGSYNDWNIKDSIPLRWKQYSITASNKGQPMAKVLDKLIEESRKNNDVAEN